MAVMATESMHGRPGRALLTACGAMTADLTWLALATLGAIGLLGGHPRAVGVLGLLGAGLLLWMAFTTFRAARTGVHGTRLRGSWRLGYVTVLTSPFSFAWWLANGAVLYTHWGAPGILGMFAALIAYSVFITYAFRWMGARVASAMVVVAYISVFILVWFGIEFGMAALALLAK